MVNMYIAYQYKNESGSLCVSAIHYLDIPKFLADYPDAVRVTEL